MSDKPTMEEESETARVIKELISIPSVNPASKLPEKDPNSKKVNLPDSYYGEAKKAAYIREYLKGIGIKDEHIREIRIPDSRVVEGYRPTLVLTIPGETRKYRELVILGHTDTVSPGDPTKWKTPPFEPRVEDGRIYGMGSVDNIAGTAGMLVAAKEIMEQGIKPKTDLVLVFAADDETGNFEFGLEPILGNRESRRSLFSDTAEAYVPDAGDNGSMVEIGEKGVLHLKFSYNGKNAKRVAVEFENDLYRELHERYPEVSEGYIRFDPPVSTFEPTSDESTFKTEPNSISGEYTSRIFVESVPLGYNLKHKVEGVVKSFMERENKKFPADRQLGIELELQGNEVDITYKGKDCHGSMPDMGRNARLASLQFEGELLVGLEKDCIQAIQQTAEENKYWSKWDCRVLPAYDVDDVFGVIEGLARKYAQKYGISIGIDKEFYCEPSETPHDSPIAKAALKAYQAVYEGTGTVPKLQKIGGGTFAKVFRRYGFNAAAGGTCDDANMAHQTNENIVIKDAEKEVGIILNLVKNWGKYL